MPDPKFDVLEKWHRRKLFLS